MRSACRQCRELLPGYIHRELTPKQRERVSRHLTICPGCYVAYTEQRQLVRELAYSLPRLGGDAPRLDKMRAAVMAEMERPAPPRLRLDQARYGLVALILMTALLLPWSMRQRSYPLPTPPQPETITPQGTAVVAVPTETATLTATLQSNYAPPSVANEATAAATDTP